MIGMDVLARAWPKFAQPRRFALQRNDDESGVSGTGIVATGIQWADGTCCLRWHTATTSVAVYTSIEDVEAIHGHGGKTVVVWLDPARGYPDGDDLVGFCTLCTGGGVGDGDAWGCAA